MTHADGWTLVEREFVIGHPVDALWGLFEDLPRVAECLPGVHVESAGTDRFAGRAEIRFGPIGASFHGEGTRETDAGRRTGVIAGRGSDSPRPCHPRRRAALRDVLRQPPRGTGPRTRIELAIRFRIQGGARAVQSRAIWSRSFADVMLSEFVGNCERQLVWEEVRFRQPPSTRRLHAAVANAQGQARPRRRPARPGQAISPGPDVDCPLGARALSCGEHLQGHFTLAGHGP